eukprot:TRINITY_DN6085_c0_g2_i11.p1 TRINITY_DN6085_c0_g2~~TRINITY_DN6085_c0_g2_i11.p1  ORF type:complete len:274 (-),score=57.10 TRINITY_DN6085_c0_g2_i11:74-820(-)
MKEELVLAGGHIANFKLHDGSLLKKAAKAEIEFFQEINDKSSKYYGERLAIDEFVPQFYGVENIGEEQWIKMEDITFGLTYPSYIDVKMGTQTHAPDYPEEKRKRHMETDKKTTTSTHGLKVSGAVIKDKIGESTLKLYKPHMKAEEVPHLFKKLLMCNDAAKPNVDALNYYIAQCKGLLEFFETVNKRYFVASSLLFVLSNLDNKYTVKLIDFAHVKPIEDMGLEKDEGFIYGLSNLIQILQSSLST